MPEPIVAFIADDSQAHHRSQILDLASGEAVSFRDLIDRLESFDVIFVGEVHTHAEHHLIQVQILQSLIGVDPNLMIGVEFFQRDQQSLIDRYISGDIDEETFLEKSHWRKIWGYPYHLYRPLFLTARREGVPVIALNAPRNIVRKVAREGLSGLDEEERSMIPREMDLNNQAHRAYVREVYERHGHGNLKEFGFFYEAQTVWDETMAETIAGAVREHEKKMIVFLGNGHIINKFGVPDRTRSRISSSCGTVMPYPLRKTITLEKGMADYVWLTGVPR
ncbi:MAG: ChaN family lipoprotein [Desulfatiglandaceae bacterium]